MSPVFTKTASENDHFGFYKVDHDDAALAAVISEQGITAVSTVLCFALSLLHDVDCICSCPLSSFITRARRWRKWKGLHLKDLMYVFLTICYCPPLTIPFVRILSPQLLNWHQISSFPDDLEIILPWATEGQCRTVQFVFQIERTFFETVRYARTVNSWSPLLFGYRHYCQKRDKTVNASNDYYSVLWASSWITTLLRYQVNLQPMIRTARDDMKSVT